MAGVDRRKALGLAFAVAFGLAGWALSELVEGLEVLPYIALPLAAASMLLIGAMMYFDWSREHRRRSLPGLSVHMAVQVREQPVPRRRYIFDLGAPGFNGAAFYLSASNRFVFSVEDTNGEFYSVEALAGSRGLPIAEVIYLALEATTDGIRTEMRVSVNGRTITSRELPFPVSFPPFENATVGANRHGTENAAFLLRELVVLDRSLDHREMSEMLGYMCGKHPLGEAL